MEENLVPNAAAPSETTETPERRRRKRQVIEGNDDSALMENKFCMFLKDNPNVVDSFQIIKGKVYFIVLPWKWKIFFFALQWKKCFDD